MTKKTYKEICKDVEAVAERVRRLTKKIYDLDLRVQFTEMNLKDLQKKMKEVLKE